MSGSILGLTSWYSALGKYLETFKTRKVLRIRQEQEATLYLLEPTHHCAKPPTIALFEREGGRGCKSYSMNKCEIRCQRYQAMNDIINMQSFLSLQPLIIFLTFREFWIAHSNWHPLLE
jgi:hypothetical protein